MTERDLVWRMQQTLWRARHKKKEPRMATTDPTQVVSIRILARDGEEIVPAVGTVYRTSDEAGELTENLVFVAMTQEQYNEIQDLWTDTVEKVTRAARAVASTTGTEKWGAEERLAETVGEKMKRIHAGRQIVP